MDKYICIHGHFYQPPRENAWLEAVEMQDSAFPYHDWNARITAECYGPNTASRILNPDGRIIGIMNNFSRISFNIGPTLLSWMEYNEPEIYQNILTADKRSREIYNGHGSAIAQVYNHIIMPLANVRDKRTQIHWGIRDFEHRFQRKPEGMWLAETAVDVETLELLAEYGIKFTILAPRQARRVRDPKAAEWYDVANGRIDPRRPYLCKLPSGSSIALFFYDGPISQGLAFEGLLNSGESYAHRLLAAFDNQSDEPQLAHVATDGESYGHHHHHGEMALSYCMHYLESEHLAKITIYGDYLEKHPPDWEVEIFGDSSWSCVHGVERWRDDCGCSSGGHPGWNQQWRKGLRTSLNWLRDQLAEVYETMGAELFKDPWAAREDYISVLFNRSVENVNGFFDRHAKTTIAGADAVKALRLLEMQRHALFMFTSCGWFFDEISGIEATQVLQYAARAAQLAREVGGRDVEDEFVQMLETAQSNIPEHQNGRVIYEKFVRPAEVSLLRVAAHFAVSSLFHDYAAEDVIYSFDVRTLRQDRLEAGKLRLGLGMIHIRSRLTWAERDVTYAVLHLGDQNLSGAVRDFMGDEEYAAMRRDMQENFDRGDVPDIVRCIDRHFEDHNYSLWHLFRDQQRDIMGSIFRGTETEVENFYRAIYRDHYHLMNAMVAMGNPLPRILRSTVDFVINRDLRRALETLPIDEEKYRHLVDEVHKWGVPLERDFLGYIGSRQISERVQRLSQHPLDYELLKEIESLLRKYYDLDAPLHLWHSQNVIYQIGLQQFFLRQRLAGQGEQGAASWVERFKIVSNLLGVKLD